MVDPLHLFQEEEVEDLVLDHHLDQMVEKEVTEEKVEDLHLDQILISICLSYNANIFYFKKEPKFW